MMWRVWEKTAALFHPKIKAFIERFSNFRRAEGTIFFVHFHCIRCTICSAAKYSSEERFPLRGFQIQPVTGCADCFHEDFYRELLVFRLRDVEGLLAALSNEKSINAPPFSSHANKAINDVLRRNAWKIDITTRYPMITLCRN